jgi:hypothetical protein
MDKSDRQECYQNTDAVCTGCDWPKGEWDCPASASTLWNPASGGCRCESELCPMCAPEDHTAEDEEIDPDCPSCQGTGIGYPVDRGCGSCGGTGMTRAARYDYDDYEPWDDYEPDYNAECKWDSPY